MRSLETTSGDKSETTNIDNLVNLIDTTLHDYQSKHTVLKETTDKVTELLDKVNTNSNNNKPTKQLDNDHDVNTRTNDVNTRTNDVTTRTNDVTTRTNDVTTRTNDVNTKTNDDFTTYRGQTTKRHNTSDEKENKNDATKHDSDETSDLFELNNDLTKSINPDGEVVVDNARLSTANFEQIGSNNALLSQLGIGNKRNKLIKQTDMKEKDLGDSILNEIQGEETFIKSINPEGQVVVNNSKEGKARVWLQTRTRTRTRKYTLKNKTLQKYFSKDHYLSLVPKRRPHQLSHVPNSPPAMYSQLPGVTNRIPSPSPPQMNALAGQPPGIPMNGKNYSGILLYILLNKAFRIAKNDTPSRWGTSTY